MFNSLFNPQLALHYLKKWQRMEKPPQLWLTQMSSTHQTTWQSSFLITAQSHVTLARTRCGNSFLATPHGNVHTDLHGSTSFEKKTRKHQATPSLRSPTTMDSSPSRIQNKGRHFPPNLCLCKRASQDGLRETERTALFLESALESDDATATKVPRTVDDTESVVKPRWERGALNEVAFKEVVRHIVKDALPILKAFVVPTVVDAVRTRLQQPSSDAHRETVTTWKRGQLRTDRRSAI